MFRRISSLSSLFLCQSADWQIVVEAKNEEDAATLAIEKIMKMSLEEENETGKLLLSMVVCVEKLSDNLVASEKNDTISYYSPIILANAGFHSEAANLHSFLQKELEDNE